MPASEEVDLVSLAAGFERAYPEEILRWGAEKYGKKLAVVTSFGPTGMVTLHMLSRVAPQTPVLTLDTGLLFEETYDLIDEVEAKLGITVTRVRPELTVDEQAAQYGDALWQKDPDKCCFMRKTIPLGKALDGYAAWIAGIRRDQSSGRAATPIISRDSRYGLLKINPLATWTEEMVWTYIRAHELPYNRLHDQGFRSIGCHTCTQASSGEGYERDGRWSWSSKTECGIHMPASEGAGR
jgi:phosphoadenosine phosphosulfate reductase